MEPRKAFTPEVRLSIRLAESGRNWEALWAWLLAEDGQATPDEDVSGPQKPFL